MNTREAVLRKVISIIPKEQINWQAWAKGATKLLNMHTSDYSIDALELFKFYNE